MTVGIFIFLYFFFPLLSWEIYYGRVFASSNLDSPIPRSVLEADMGVGSFVKEQFSALSTNYDDARNWYPNLRPEEAKAVTTYSLSIPKIKVVDAVVSTDNYDLSSHLVQYFGSSVPGQNGTSVIFGHSTLPALFNPKNYKTIFANLYQMQIGDDIMVTVSGVTYKFKIFSMTVVDPDDTSIAYETYDTSYITLVTCTPPGTIWKRLVVRAKLSL